MGKYQILAKQLYEERGYTSDPLTLALGVCEESGELAKAINMFHNPKYIHSDHARSDNVEHEMKDILIYLSALANALEINLDI